MKLPNIRKLFTPDPNCILFDSDLQQADAQVVAWEANDDDLKAIFRDPSLDLHDENCKTVFGHYPVGRYKSLRKRVKAGVHATNYGSSARTLGRTLGITTHEATKFQRTWFGAHPGIKEWHDRTLSQLQASRTIRNAFGYKRYYFDRIEGVLPQALAWIPQSTVALTINKGMLNLDKDVPQVELLLQVHDSVVGQYPKFCDPLIRPRIRDALLIPIPYDDPLVIGVDLTISSVSWGDVHKTEWEPTCESSKTG